VERGAFSLSLTAMGLGPTRFSIDFKPVGPRPNLRSSYGITREVTLIVIQILICIFKDELS
jgi:hypothetical protein